MKKIPYKDYGLEKEFVKRALAWLEKQSEQDDNEDSNILQRFSFYSYKDEPNILYLSELYVNGEYRNKGIGTKILEVTDEVARSLNCHTIRLKTKKDSNAERLYRTHGYNSLTTEDSDKIWLEKQGEQPIKITSKHAEGKLKEMLNDITETKDKKIKKSLINYINAHGNGGDFTKEEYINWLRKQSEKKPTSVNNFRTWLYIVADVLTEFNGIGQYLDSSDCREMAERLREKYCFDDTSSDWQKVYQKGLNVGETYGRNKAKKEQEQKHVEWSEEDKAMVEDIIEAIDTQYAVTDYNEMVNWLKSLKERYTWKPSEEQMKALEDAIEFLGCTKKVRNDLKSLYEQLKKLKG